VLRFPPGVAQAAHSDSLPRRAPVAPALFGASFAVIAALAGAFAHGAAAPEAFRNAPSFNALFLLTAFVLLGGALSGIAADRIHGFAAQAAEGAGWTRRALAAAAMATGPRALGLLAPALAGQYLAHTILSADSAIAGALAAPAATATAPTPGAATSALLAEHPGHSGLHGVPGPPGLSGYAAALSNGAAGSHAAMILPMLAAHALGVLACLAICALADRALRSLCERILRPAIAPAAPLLAAPIPNRAPVLSPRAAIAGAGPRAPPRLLALAG